MNSMVYILIAVIIVAAIAVFLMRGGKNKTPSQPTPAPKPLEQAKSVRVPAAVPETDYILNAQDYINQQRYDDAISELKQGLKKKPNNSAIMLKLLNVFAITNRRDEFDSLFRDIDANTDTATVKQAQDLKSMLDEEATLKNPPEPITAASPVHAEAAAPTTDDDMSDMSLDFGDMEDFSTDDAATDGLSTDAPVRPQSDNEASLSFDDLESQLLADGTTNTADDSVLEFSADLELPTASDSAPTTPSVAESTSDAFELSFDTDIDNVKPVDTAAELTAATPTQALHVEDASIDDNVLSVEPLEAELELDTEALSTHTADSPTHADSDLAEDANDEIELSWDEPLVDSVIDIQPVVPEALDDTNETLVEADISTHGVDDSLIAAPVFEDSIIDQPVVEEPVVEEPVVEEPVVEAPVVEAPSTNELDNAELVINDLSIDETTQPIQTIMETTSIDAPTESALSAEAPTATTEYDDTFSQLDALSATNMLGATTAQTPKVNEIEPLAATNAVIDTSDAAVLPTESVAAPVIDDSEFMQSFGFLQGLDNSQITLDLAQQYLELGEYDSAKRLVTEVMDGDSSDAQKTVARDILMRMN